MGSDCINFSSFSLSGLLTSLLLMQFRVRSKCSVYIHERATNSIVITVSTHNCTEKKGWGLSEKLKTE